MYQACVEDSTPLTLTPKQRDRYTVAPLSLTLASIQHAVYGETPTSTQPLRVGQSGGGCMIESQRCPDLDSASDGGSSW
jgi:hypothetical protein